LDAAKKSLEAGQSPAKKKARARLHQHAAESFSQWAERWLLKHTMAESTRDVRRSVYERDLKGTFGKLMLSEITHNELRVLCDKIVSRGAPAVAVHAREIVMMVFRYAAERGQQHENPADRVRPCSIAVFQPRDRALAPEEIGLFYEYLDYVQCSPTLRLAVKLLLLTMLRKSELANATWDEINFSNGLWTIPAGRMKRRNPHNVYLCRQAVDILIALRTCAGGSRYLLPSRYDPDLPISEGTLNRVLVSTAIAAREDGKPLADFSPHDLRRTASTQLHEAGYNSDWIEKCLAHEQRGVRAVYNKAEYAEQRRAMMQDWADMIDGWTVKAP
jgi:integrase